MKDAVKILSHRLQDCGGGVKIALVAGFVHSSVHCSYLTSMHELA